ncbi:MAG: hypothetical protein AAFT19_07130 [Pseudomonadota bacterium]
MKIVIPDFALLVLIGATGSGRGNCAYKRFLSTDDAVDPLHQTAASTRRPRFWARSATSLMRPHP